MSKPDIAVILCTHRPHEGRLLRTLEALARQDLPSERWECLLVDNASGGAFPAHAHLTKVLPSLRLATEPRLGLGHARRRGCLETSAPLLVFVDDDNLLAPDYLRQVLELFGAQARLGGIGGRLLPEFEAAPPAWTEEFHSLLALRDLGSAPLYSPDLPPGPLKSWPSCAPVGAGMALRREALAAWLGLPSSTLLPDRRGDCLSSGGDNDMIAHVMEAGWQVAYFPTLFLVHLMPAGRLETAYLGRLNRGIQSSWMRVLDLHGINPWTTIPAWTAPLRRARAWVRRRAWRGGAEWIRWQGDCGHFEGRSAPAGSLRESLRSLGLGWLAHHCLRRPLRALRELLRQGGPLVRRQVRLGRVAMAQAAAVLPRPAAQGDSRPLRPHLLTGARFWDQTAFCLWTLAQHSERPLAPVIHDDGSLGDQHREKLRRLFPAAEFPPLDETLGRLDALLPETRYPRLRERWLHYPNIRKLIDVHLGSQGWKLVLDSDMLFFRRPEELVAWMDAPSSPLHALDCTESYGYPRPLLDELAGAGLAPLVNVGLCGLNSSDINWDQMEAWITVLERAHGQSYYLEQALTAMLLAGKACTVLAAERYVTMPAAAECLAPTAVLHHYVDLSKRWYFTKCWRQAIDRQAPDSP